MKNKEKYIDEIINLMLKRCTIAFDVKNKKIVSCYGLDCENCAMYERGKRCNYKTILKWLNSEYKEENIENEK